MVFRFETNITVLDMWKLSMQNIYRSMVGVSNIILSVAIILLTIRFWGSMEPILRSIFVVCCILFPVMQPLMIWKRAAQQVATLPKDMVTEIDDTGIHISTEHQKDHVQWNRVRRIIKQKGVTILAIEGGRGYMLTDRILGEQKEAFLDYIESKTKKSA